MDKTNLTEYQSALIGALLSLASPVSCVIPIDPPPPPVDTGSALLSVTVDGAARVTAAIASPAMSGNRTVELEPDGREWLSLIASIPAGTDVAFTVRAYDDRDELLAERIATRVAVQPDETVAVAWLPVRDTVTTTTDNTPPAATELILSRYDITPEQAVVMHLRADDMDGDELTYVWSSTGGSFDDPSLPSPAWTAPPTAGPVTISVAISDGRDGVQTVSFHLVNAPDRPEAYTPLSFDVNSWPMSASVTADPVRVMPGTRVALDNLAVDHDGDPLTIRWRDAGGECAGLFDNPTSSSTHWTAPALEPATPACAIAVEIDDGRGGVIENDVAVYVSEQCAIGNIPPVVVSASILPASVAPDQAVHLEVRALDANGDPLQFSWIVGDGEVLGQSDHDRRSRLTWLSPYTCDGPVKVSARVSDECGESAVYTFDIDIDMPVEQLDIPDPAFIDSDCDGIDGDLEFAVFVHPSGTDDVGAGSREVPYATLAYALDQVAGQGAPQVLVAAGRYPEQVSVPDGVGVFGGYDRSWRRAANNVALLDPPGSIGVSIENNVGGGHLQYLWIRTRDAQAQQSAMGIALNGVEGAPFYIQNNTVLVGRGGDGIAGATGSGGAGGSHGGNGGIIAPGPGGPPAPGCSGHGGWAGVPGASGASGGGPLGGDGGLFGPAPLVPGAPGGQGGSGANGGAPSANQALGTTAGLSWVAGAGLAGSSGGCGGGGGGGHAGACVIPPIPFPVWADGGGGGGGGRGGLGGNGGGGAGGSFGVFAIQASAAVIVDNHLETAGGGHGGAGGTGGPGGPGGNGGIGHPCFAGSGSNGGAGGRGGAGGSGIGGAGGMSVGIHESASAGIVVAGNTTLLGPAGAGAAGGSSSAPAGLDGIQAAHHIASAP